MSISMPNHFAAIRGGADPQLARRRLGRGELVRIVAFWLLLAVVTAANRLLDPRGPGPGGSMAGGWVVIPFVESLLWALLTPPIFLFVARHGPADERQDVLGARGGNAATVVLFVAVVLAAALLVNIVATTVRFELFPFPRGRGGRGGGPFPDEGLLRIDRFALINHSIVALGILLAGIARDSALRARLRTEQTTRLQAQLAEARLDALRRQLDPHFLFNTLNAVSALVERDPRGVRRMIARLSELLRHSIEGADEQEIPLSRELELLRRYVDIMQVRFEGRLEVAISVEDRARDALVPNLVLQPLVENAIKHGLSGIEGTGHVAIEGEVAGDSLRLRVRDDGRGLAADAPSGSGVGIGNTRERLAGLYGDAGRLSLSSIPSGGTVAEIVLPFHTRADLRAGAESPSR